MKSNTPSIDKKIIQEFKDKFSYRLNKLEAFYQTHGGEAWEGENIEQFLRSALEQQKSELIEKIEKAKIKEVGNKSQKDQIWGVNHGLDKAKEIIEE